MTKHNCITCHKEYDGLGLENFRKQGLIKIGENWKCRECIRTDRKNHREFLYRDVMGVRKREDLEKEWAIKRAQKEKERQEKEEFEKNHPTMPFIPGAQEIKVRVSKQLHLYLTRTEKQILFKKYINLGLPMSLVKEKIDGLSNCLNLITQKLLEKHKNLELNEELDAKIKAEFELMRSQAEEELNSYAQNPTIKHAY